jgi:superfamily II DNA/RNA helicase
MLLVSCVLNHITPLWYILPAIVHISNQPPLANRDGPITLILTPTRELAHQIQQVATDFGASSSVRNTCIFEGAPKGPQVILLKSYNIHIGKFEFLCAKLN